MEKTASHSSCLSRPASAGFLVSSGHNDQEMGDQGRGERGGASESSFSSGFSASYSFGDDGITSDMVCDDEDDSLQDTACSSAAVPKVTILKDIFMKSLVTLDAEEMKTSLLANNFFDTGLGQQVNGAVKKVITGDDNNGKQLHELSDLRKRGLCLVPLSLLVDYLG